MSKSLTLARLSEYDDILTDHLIDKVHFWTKTHKADRHKNHSSRSVKTQEVVDILKQHIINRNGKIGDAISAFLGLCTVETFYKRLSEAQKKDFVKHTRKYLCMYVAQAGFEICSTDRYPGPKSESCVIANRSLRSGEVLKHLAGTIVAMTEEEENFYETDHDFSIIFSSRLNSMCLFLGPARFVNHDCHPNGAFVTQGASIAITTIRPVQVGEEITVFYSPDYFGPKNGDCLCASCEHAGIGGFSKMRAEDPVLTATKSNQPLETPDFGICTEDDSLSRKFKYVHTIEVSPVLKPANSSVRSISQLITPPDSDISLNEMRKTLDWNNEDDDRYTDQIYAASFPSDEDDYEDEEVDEDEVIVKIEHVEDNGKPTGAATNGNANLKYAEKSSIVPGEKEQDVAVELDNIYQKVLRPRRAVHDYNLKRQSLLSINPLLASHFSRVRHSKRDRNINVDYCTVCDEELPFEAIIEEIWSVTEAIGIQTILCKRCERHAALYPNPWPDRTTKCAPERDVEPERSSTKSSREETPAQILLSTDRTAKSVSPKKSKLVLPGSNLGQCSSELALEHTQIVPVIELAKARMKGGGIYLPRLARLYKPSLPNRPLDSSNSHNSGHSSKLERKHSQSEWDPSVDSSMKSQSACIPCRRLKQRCSRVESGTNRCDRCCRLNKSCIISDEAGRQKSDPPALGFTALAAIRKRTLSPDSLVAALQVKSPKKMKKNVETCLLSQTSDPTCLQESKPVIVPEQIILQTQTKPQNTFTLPTAQDDKALVLAQNPTVKPEPVTTARSHTPERRRSTKGSWYYVDVNSSDSEEIEPAILPCRTRRQERARASGSFATDSKTYIDIDSSDDSSAEVLPYKPPERTLSITRRKRRTPMWDYVSIDSEEENQKTYITDEPRSARRRSTIHYKE